jgi:hypothetical protein
MWRLLTGKANHATQQTTSYPSNFMDSGSRRASKRPAEDDVSSSRAACEAKCHFIMWLVHFNGMELTRDEKLIKDSELENWNALYELAHEIWTDTSDDAKSLKQVRFDCPSPTRFTQAGNSVCLVVSN